ncbi:MAG: hydrolase 1, exosortase A system-associated [Pseudomonadota bacterium]
MNFEEQALTFRCGDAVLIGIAAIPEKPTQRGVLVVVGGPQYRVGSHRQFLLLSRQLAEAGVPVLRFDYRGMGDSDGEIRTFEAVDEDISMAIDAFFQAVPSLREVVIWGLCDAASAALMYVARDKRVSGLVLANPWVRTSQGMAKTMVKHYYGSRFLQREFWQKLLSGQVNIIASARSFAGSVCSAMVKKKTPASEVLPFPERMALGLEGFTGPVLMMLSGQDLTAQEFEEMTKTSPTWQRALKRPRLEWRRLEEATHTFSTKAWRDQAGRWTIDWLKSW